MARLEGSQPVAPAGNSPTPTLDVEHSLWSPGMRSVAGVDEVGRGSWAGPVVAAAVVLPDDDAVASTLSGVRDSKILSPSSRERLAALICRTARAVAIGAASADIVDRYGVLAATARAMEVALAGLGLKVDAVVIDGLPLAQLKRPHRAIVRGDSLCLSIAAASIVAKVERDRWMVSAGDVHPGYGFAAHKGYGTDEHRAALERLGPCPIHRRRFAPIAACTAGRLGQSDQLLAGVGEP